MTRAEAQQTSRPVRSSSPSAGTGKRSDATQDAQPTAAVLQALVAASAPVLATVIKEAMGITPSPAEGDVPATCQAVGRQAVGCRAPCRKAEPFDAKEMEVVENVLKEVGDLTTVKFEDVVPQLLRNLGLHMKKFRRRALDSGLTWQQRCGIDVIIRRFATGAGKRAEKRVAKRGGK